MRPHIVIVNEVPNLAAETDVVDFAAACQHVLDTRFSRAWGHSAHVTYPKGLRAEADQWQLALLKDSDQAGALGYHDLTAAGLPSMSVFVGTDMQYGYDWRVTASHEIFEAIVDPWLTFVSDFGDGRGFALEIGDPCEADENAIIVAGIPISDFVLPPWFLREGPGPWDAQAFLPGPGTVAAGGYAQWTADFKRWHVIGQDTRPDGAGEKDIDASPDELRRRDDESAATDAAFAGNVRRRSRAS